MKLQLLRDRQQHLDVAQLHALAEQVSFNDPECA
jgi:hypothetical protein